MKVTFCESTRQALQDGRNVKIWILLLYPLDHFIKKSSIKNVLGTSGGVLKTSLAPILRFSGPPLGGLEKFLRLFWQPTLCFFESKQKVLTNKKESDLYLASINFYPHPKFLPHRISHFERLSSTGNSRFNLLYLENRSRYEAEIFSVVSSY